MKKLDIKRMQEWVTTLIVYNYQLLQGKHYGLEELQGMLMEMAKGFECPSMYCGVNSVIDESPCLKRTRFDTNMMENKGSHFQVPDLNLYCS